MAKVDGPLLSVSASGSVAGRYVFERYWYGHRFRKLAVQHDPQTPAQLRRRHYFGIVQRVINWASRTPYMRSDAQVRDVPLLRLVAAGLNTWTAIVQSAALRDGRAAYNAAAASWSTLDAGEQNEWGNAARQLWPPLLPVADLDDGEQVQPGATSGFLLFFWVYLLWLLGIVADAPGAIPPVWELDPSEPAPPISIVHGPAISIARFYSPWGGNTAPPIPLIRPTNADPN